MENISSYITYLAIVSVSVERIVQLLKVIPGMTKLMSLSDGKGIQVFSILIGIITVYLVGPGPFSNILKNIYVSSIILGLLVSAGSGIWYDLIGIIRNTKTSIAELKKT